MALFVWKIKPYILHVVFGPLSVTSALHSSPGLSVDLSSLSLPASPPPNLPTLLISFLPPACALPLLWKCIDSELTLYIVAPMPKIKVIFVSSWNVICFQTIPLSDC